jgi:hypothetical protein
VRIGSPLKIEILLHCHCSRTRFGRDDAPAVVEAFKDLEHSGAIIPAEHGHITTPLGNAWVASLCNVGRPREAYVDEHGRIVQ